MAGQITVEALDGETVDQLVWRTLGRAEPAVSIVLDANPGASEDGLFLRRGTLIRIPAAAHAPATRPMTQLWT